MESLDNDEVRECMYMLSKAETPQEALFAWSLIQNKHQGISAMVALRDYKKVVIPTSVKKYIVKSSGYLVPYFSSENIYFLDNELYSGMFNAGEFKFGIDYTLMFDTNIASYVNNVELHSELTHLAI